MAAAIAKHYFRFRICWCHCLQKVKVYQQTKFRQHNLNSRLPYNYFWFGKTNVRHFGILLPVSISTIFFRNLRYSASGYRILSKSEHPLRKYDVISIFQDGGRGRSILLPVSYLLTSLPSEHQSLSANQISSTYLNSRLRYLPVWKNKRPPFWNSTSGFDLDHFAVNVLFFMRVPNLIQIGPCTAELWRHIDFQNGGSQPYCICFGVITDHPRSAFRGLNCVLKSLVCRINSSEDIAMYRFWRFGLKLPIRAPFWGVFSPYDVTHRPDPQQHRPWAETRRLNHSA